MAETLKLYSLSSLVDYLKSGADERGYLFISVISPTEVKVYSSLNERREREKIVSVMAMVPDFLTERFVDKEEFIIRLQSLCIDNPDKAELLSFAGTVESNTIAEYGDDGISQKGTIRKGLTGKEDALVPNPVSLKPFKTFQEIDQPEIRYIFRMRESRGIECGLFEADGGIWKNVACGRIKEYLQRELEGVENITILA